MSFRPSKAFSHARALASVFAKHQRQPTPKNAAKPGTAELFVYDIIGSDWFSEGVTAKSVRDFLKTNADASRLNIFVNSPGGDVFEAKAIFSQLDRFAGEVVVYVDGLAASAATFLVLAADRIVTAPHATWMIHEASSIAWGPADELRAMAEVLDQLSGDIAGMYAARGKKKSDHFRDLMKAETWLTAEQALELGLTDKVATFDEDNGGTDPAPNETAEARAFAQRVISNLRRR